MKKSRGFKLCRRLITLWNLPSLLRPRRRYLRLRETPPRPSKSHLFDWIRRIFASGRGYRRIGAEEKPPPKGHLAVYVAGSKDEEGEPRRYVVPVVYFNHPLFGELLKEAAEEFGYEHAGGITIPCPAARFETVRTRIAAQRSGFWCPS